MIENIITELESLCIFFVSFLWTAVATAVIETVFWFFAGFKSIKFEALIFIINLLSNLALNISFLYIPQTPVNILAAEISVIIFEFVCIKMFFRKYCAKKLIKLTFLANLLSYSLGVVYFSIFK